MAAIKMIKSNYKFLVVFLVYIIFVIGEYCLMTYFALKSTSDGYSATFVGMFSLFLWIGIILSITQTYTLSKRLGRANTLFYALIGAFFVSALSIFFDGNSSRLLLSLFLGVFGGIAWVVAETWVAESAPSGKRGLTVGLFETTVGIGLMIGPGLIPLLTQLEMHPPHFVSMLMTAAVLICFIFLIVNSSGISTPSETDQKQINANDNLQYKSKFNLFAITLFSGMMESGIYSLMPSVSMRLGQTYESAAWLGAFIGLGSAIIQAATGITSRLLEFRRFLLLLWILITLTSITLSIPNNGSILFFWAASFGLAVFGGAVFTLTIIEAGNSLHGHALTKLIGRLILFYSIGTAVGPFLGGLIFDASGINGLAIGLFSIGICGAISSYLIGKRLKERF